MFQCQFWEIFNNTYFVKHLWRVAFEKSCSFAFNSTKTDTICQKNFLAYHQLILLYYFHQKILKEKWQFLKHFFGQACFFLHSGNQVFEYHAYIFTFHDIMNYLHIKQACMHNLCMNRASLDHKSLDRKLWNSTTCSGWSK